MMYYLLAFIFGGTFGFFLCALLVANSYNDGGNKK